MNKNKKAFSVVKIFSKYNVLILLVATYVFFSVLMPKSFFTWFNFKSMLNNQATITMLALAVLVTIAGGHYNLSVGFHVGIAHILVVGLQVRNGWPWPAAILFVLAIGIFIGLVNGLLVSRVGLSAFIATLGFGNFIYGIAFWYTGGRQIIGRLPPAFTALAGNILGIPASFLLTLAVGAVLYFVMEYMPLGRYFYFLGANTKAAELSGISAKKYVPIMFMIGGFITSLAGVMLGALLQVGQTTVGPEFMLNAQAGALLGAVAFKVGKVNVWGTFCAVLLLAVIVAGLQQLGASYWVEPIFNGFTLIVAVSLALVAERNKATKM
ncbi:MAG: ABC transporter permease, partial [Synergistaceae bacterium]|nr:ABC transporter permease [Synergistaceae bacterium]